MQRAIAIVAIATIFSAVTYGQSPAFEVASVKVNKTGDSEPTGDAKNGRFSVHNVPMFILVARAYGVNFDRVVGPDWFQTERYDVDAKFPPDTAGDNMWLMLRNLLVERFKLAVHHEEKPAPVWALTIAKNGPKLREAAAESAGKGKCRAEGAQLTCQIPRIPMSEFPEVLREWVSRNWFGVPVVDQTGLKGIYDISVTWTMTRRPDDTVEPPGVSLFDALEDQLGLKLELRKVPIDRIVVDHMERVPTEN